MCQDISCRQWKYMVLGENIKFKFLIFLLCAMYFQCLQSHCVLLTVVLLDFTVQQPSIVLLLPHVLSSLSLVLLHTRWWRNRVMYNRQFWCLSSCLSLCGPHMPVLSSLRLSRLLDNIRVMVIVWSLRENIIRTALCWIVWHNVHSPQHTYMSSSNRFNRLGLSYWDAYSVHRGGCLELYYCNMVQWFWWDLSLISTTDSFPSVLWHCWFGHPDCKAPDRRSKFLIRETCTRNLVQKTWTCVIISRTSFFSYEKLGWIRTLLYFVRETWSHVIELLRRYWLEVRFVRWVK